ncbi:MAG: lysylphosphatidylglycerol synthase domain-containing protein [Desulfosporosinus sp.]|nr:lysylphosphatidylglycerol synthase domain-containing protein [Desulfosporosinus sp.]
MPTKTKLKLFIGIIITAATVYYSIGALQSLQVSVLFNADINWGLALVSVAIFAYANYIRGLAYSRGIDRDMDRMTALQIVGIGHAANMVLPFHVGEGLRAAFFPRGYSAIKRTNLLIIPAFADFAAIMILSICAVPFAGFKDQNLLKALWILTFLCIAALIVFMILIFFRSPLRSYLHEYLNVDTVKMMNWVLLSWIILLVSTWIGLVAFGFPWVVSIRLSLAVFAATNIINFIPATPGAIGLFEYGTILGLGGLGIDPTTALSASLLLHLIQYAALLPLGGYLYIKSLHGQYGEALSKMWCTKDKKSMKLKRTK